MGEDYINIATIFVTTFNMFKAKQVDTALSDKHKPRSCFMGRFYGRFIVFISYYAWLFHYLENYFAHTSIQDCSMAFHLGTSG